VFWFELVFLEGGIINPAGTFSPSKICFDTQHFILDEQMPGTSRIASQKPESLSATHTPGHFSKINKEIKKEIKRQKMGLNTLFQTDRKNYIDK
jgi:hypothetical protein